ncbi:MAG TPA: type II toxin-antitoxin system RelE/ParE family toxin [Bacteroidetes bacterium]|nr:type II toxin-antitoxin system RelE/ParE family toxin [Bacteroidota bacterium]
MAKVILRQEAIDDLTDIWKYTLDKWSESQADKYFRSIKFACSEIGDYPEIGTEYSGISSNLLGFKTGKHIIFYHVISDVEIEVIRILHERMDLKNRLTE